MQKGIDYLRKKLNNHKIRVDTRYEQYDMKFNDRLKSVVIDPKIQQMYRATLGWNTRAVDALAERLVLRDFKNDNFNMQEIFDINSPDVFFDNAILNALIASCSFVYISKDKNKDIRLQVIEANNATGIIDPITNLLVEGYAVLQRDINGNPIIEAYFEKDKTTIIDLESKTAQAFKHKAGHPLLVPVIHKPDAIRPFGRSRITRSAEYWQEYAKRTLERSDITAEFYSFPQKYVLGMSSEAEALDGWRATISTFLQFDKDEDGDSPKLGQFQTASMQPFIEQLRMAASGFAGETGLTLDDLGFVSDNPSSADAIKASHETLAVMARKAQRCFGTAFVNIGYVAACLRDDFNYNRQVVYETKVRWEPVFAVDGTALSSIGDGAIKINQAIPDYITGETIRDLTGVEGGK